MKPRLRYGILDDFGEVVRWKWDKPSKLYKYIVQRINMKPEIDWNNFDEALF